MLTKFDSELFPDDCEVVHLPLHNQWIYLIQKNGSTSLRKESQEQQSSILMNQEISTLSCIDVYLREPRERFLSGVNTFVQHLVRDHRKIDRDTCIFLASRYLFMNRHYLPQFHWLLNLSRFIDKECHLRFHNLEELEKVTDYKHRSGIIPADDSTASAILEHAPKDVGLWWFLDQMLLDNAGKTMTWGELTKQLYQHPSGCLHLITQRSREILDCIALD